MGLSWDQGVLLRFVRVFPQSNQWRTGMILVVADRLTGWVKEAKHGDCVRSCGSVTVECVMDKSWQRTHRAVFKQSKCQATLTTIYVTGHRTSAFLVRPQLIMVVVDSNGNNSYMAYSTCSVPRSVWIMEIVRIIERDTIYRLHSTK